MAGKWRRPHLIIDRSKVSAGNVDPVLLGWFAGIIDGEGCITITATHRHLGGSYYNVHMNVGNSDPRIVLKCQAISAALLGVPATYTYRKTSREGCAQVYRWEIEGRVAALLLTVVGPHLISKGQQARLAIQLQEHIEQCRNHKQGLSPEMLAIRERLRSEIRALNVGGTKRGELYAPFYDGSMREENSECQPEQ